MEKDTYIGQGRRKRKLLEVIKERGYSTQRSLARAIHSNGCGSSVESVVAYLNQAINGKRPVSPKFVRAISQACEMDEGYIYNLFNSTLERRMGTLDQEINYSLERKLEDTYESLRGVFKGADLPKKARICADFEEFSSWYES